MKIIIIIRMKKKKLCRTVFGLLPKQCCENCIARFKLYCNLKGLRAEVYCNTIIVLQAIVS